MDDSDQEFFFDFRNPLYSDPDSDFDDDQCRPLYTKCRSLDIIHVETKVSRIIFPSIEAWDLATGLLHVMATLSHGQQEEEGNSLERDRQCTNSGPRSTFQVADQDLSVALANLIDIFFTEMSVIKEKRREVDEGWPTPIDELPRETHLRSRYRREKLPIRKRKIRDDEEKETAELGHREGRPTKCHSHSLKVTAPSDAKLKEHVLADTATSPETEDGVAISSTTPKVMIVGPGTPDPAEEEIHRLSQSTPKGESTQPWIVTGSSDGRPSTGGQIFSSRRERLRARILDPYYYENGLLCVRCGSQQNKILNESACIFCTRPLGQQWGNQEWISMKECNDSGRTIKLSNTFHRVEPGLSFEICENSVPWSKTRAFLIRLPSGNILWDCISFIDEETTLNIAKQGGLKAIAISSPDHMGTCARISYIFNSDSHFLSTSVRRNTKRLWDKSMEYLWDGVTLIHLGGHFPGSCILHLDYKGGIIFTGNSLKVGEDRRSVSVMLDYQSFIPAPPVDVKRILYIMQGLEFDQLYGDQPGDNIVEHAKPKVINSLQRYIRWALHDENSDKFKTENLTKREIIAKGKNKFDYT